MASSTLRFRTEPGSGVLPIDALHEILILLPAKQLCRLRTVCRAWQTLLSDPQFVAEHTARHALIVASHDKSYCDEGVLCDIIDVSGTVIKRIRLADDDRLVSTQLDLACIAKETSRICQLLNLTTGDVFSLPEELSEEHAPREMDFLNYSAAVAFGHVASTGEYKLLRVIANGLFMRNPYEQLFEVFTLGGSGDARWRGKKASPSPVDMRPLSRVTVNGIVYFFLHENVGMVNQDVRPKRIASFDLLSEEWRTIIQGPAPILVDHVHAYYANLSLVSLNGSLVLAHRNLSAKMDLWFLIDIEKCLWVKKHSVQLNLSVHSDEYLACPLVILIDGRIVTYIGSRGLLRIYNPRTSSYTDVQIGPRDGIGLYSGNLLSLANGAT